VRAGRRRRAGMTLIEVLLAVTILGIALTVLVAAAGQALGVARRSRHFSTARHLMDIVELENPIPDLAAAAGSVEGGGFDSPHDAYAWERSVEPVLDSLGEETGYYVIRTRIRWSDRGAGSYEEFVTGAYAPTEQEGVAPTAGAVEEETGGGGGPAAGSGLRAPAPVGGRGGDPRQGGEGGLPPDMEGLDGRRRGGGDGGPRPPAGLRDLRDMMGRMDARGGLPRDSASPRIPPRGRAGAGRAFTTSGGVGAPGSAFAPAAPPAVPARGPSLGGEGFAPPPPPPGR